MAVYGLGGFLSGFNSGIANIVALYQAKLAADREGRQAALDELRMRGERERLQEGSLARGGLETLGQALQVGTPAPAPQSAGLPQDVEPGSMTPEELRGIGLPDLVQFRKPRTMGEAGLSPYQQALVLKQYPEVVRGVGLKTETELQAEQKQQAAMGKLAGVLSKPVKDTTEAMQRMLSVWQIGTEANQPWAAEVAKKVIDHLGTDPDVIIDFINAFATENATSKDMGTALMAATRSVQGRPGSEKIAPLLNSLHGMLVQPAKENLVSTTHGIWNAKTQKWETQWSPHKEDPEQEIRDAIIAVEKGTATEDQKIKARLASKLPGVKPSWEQSTNLVNARRAAIQKDTAGLEEQIRKGTLLPQDARKYAVGFEASAKRKRAEANNYMSGISDAERRALETEANHLDDMAERFNEYALTKRDIAAPGEAPTPRANPERRVGTSLTPKGKRVMERFGLD